MAIRNPIPALFNALGELVFKMGGYSAVTVYSEDNQAVPADSTYGLDVDVTRIAGDVPTKDADVRQLLHEQNLLLGRMVAGMEILTGVDLSGVEP